MKKKTQFKTADDFILDVKLRGFLEKSHMRQSTLARHLSINKSTLHNWLNGCLPQSVLALSKVADFFGVTLDELCFERQMVASEKEPLVLRVSIEFEDSGTVKPKSL